MWKQDFYATTQILCEITFGHFEAPKTAILTIWSDLSFELLGTFDIYKYEMFQIIKIQSFQNY